MLTALTADHAPSARPVNDRARYARAIEASRRARWDIDVDVIRGRNLDLSHKFLPDGLSRMRQFSFLSPAQQLLMSQVQGRTYANIFGLVERFIGTKVLQLSGNHWLGDQTALEALVRFSDEELKHQALFRRLEAMMAACMPPGYRTVADPNDVACVVLSRSTWSVLALTCHIELFTQAHYLRSIQPDDSLSPLWKDVFKYHWMEEAQHAVLDELEWTSEDRELTMREKDLAVSDLVALVGAVDGILQAQSVADAEYFMRIAGVPARDGSAVRAGMLSAYRWQYILSGVQHPHFVKLLTAMTSDAQMDYIQSVLASLFTH
ncbi:MAG: hypothetical protein KIS79_17070 [Burkholderiales bacterium]|nr:hypothetical protein [Burkholderiales bacterium]